ncbi:MAG: two-component system C4-dicarboxylate transport sensor histidine kinase DctB [Planctomycetota bacterium]|jgi:two-component system C4-dicarboxylate transport sensor histidine kinase DctB
MGVLVLLFLANRRRESAQDKHAEEERLRALAGLGTMAVGFVHNLINQLMILLGSIERARNSEDLSPTTEHTLRQAAAAAGSIGEIAGRMLRLVRNDPFVTQEFELDALLQRVMSNLDTLGDDGIELRLHADDCPTSLRGDATLLESALTNHGKNRMEALGGGGVLEIRTVVRNQQLTIVVEDNGPGIDPDLVDDLFIPFRTERADRGGTGLGL